ncbi:MAG: methylated-DNA--[protein]-cysteine S-methyltransferase [Gammaproteobacteria bacterium]|nr:methylated-DNA--[protein]-cysteine S-methyltransferase [Gammaproteobacteria bacterium]NKB64922.1 methylated-DNA--[protein]-cysteine S-methyltransferase [Gammaproteobacteria bacterium]
MHVASVDTDIGTLGLVESDGRIVRLLWCCEKTAATTSVLKEAVAQLESYFAGELTTFDLPLGLEGSGFQKRVYDAMLAIPYGETQTYGEIASSLKTSAQPVGNACGSNPIPIIIPCHRVLSSNGLGGYSGQGGVEMKIRLLRLEDAIPFLI